MSKTLILRFTLIFLILSTMVYALIPPITEYKAPADNLSTSLADLSLDQTLPVPPDPDTDLMLPVIPEHIDPLAANPDPPRDHTPFVRRLYDRISSPFFAQSGPNEELIFTEQTEIPIHVETTDNN